MRERPPGQGLGPCPNVGYARRNATIRCGCQKPCAVCGWPKHAAVHLHVVGERPGDPPYDHEFKAASPTSKAGEP